VVNGRTIPNQTFARANVIVIARIINKPVSGIGSPDKNRKKEN
jgi:hypothetical protein